MGIRVDPLPNPPGDDCLACYAPGNTPKIVYALFAGIKLGDLWVPELPSPPNGVYELEQDPLNPCRWEYSNDNWDIQYVCVDTPWHGPSESSLVALWDPTPRGFWGMDESRCRTGFTNGLHQPAFDIWYGGWGWVLRKG